MKLPDLNVKKRIILSLMALMLLTILTAALASFGFLQAQNRIEDIGNVKLSKFKAASEIVIISLELEAKIRLLEGKRRTYDMDSVSYEVLQLLFNLEEAIKKLKGIGFSQQTVEHLEKQLLQLRTAVSDTNRHLKRGQQLQQDNQKKLQSVSALQDRLSRLEPSLSRSLYRKIQNIILRLKTALASQDQQQIKQLKKQVVLEVNQLSTEPDLSPIAQTLIAETRRISLNEDGVFALRFERLVHDFAYESTVEMNVARLAPLMSFSQQLFGDVVQGFDNSIDEQQFHLRVYLGVFAAIVLVSLMVGLSLMENLKSHVIDRLLRLRKNMSRFVAGERDAKGLVLDDTAIEDDEIQDMSNDLALVITTLNTRSHELEALSNFGRAMTQIRDRQEIYEQLNNNIANLIPVDSMILAVWDSAAQTFDYPVAMCFTGTNSPALIGQVKSLIAELGPRDKEIRTTNRRQLLQYSEMNEIQQQAGLFQSLAYYPLLNSLDDFLGCLVVAAEQPKAFSANSLKALQTLSRYLTISLEYTDTIARLNEVENKLFLQERWAGLGSWDEQTGRIMISTAQDLKFTAMSIKKHLHALYEWLLESPGLEQSEQRDEIKERFHELHDDIERVEQDSRRMSKKLESLQNIAALPDTEQETDITALLKDVINLVRQKFPTVSVQLVVSMLVRLTCHPQRLSQAFTDILLNACLSTQMRHGAESVVAEVKIEMKKVEHAFVLSVSNNGLSLNADQAHKMLHENDTTDSGIIGLAVSKRIIDELDGVLSIDTELSNGYLVNVKLVP
ncbi:MAG: ATP-binding protein [Aestuariibacter sp.]